MRNRGALFIGGVLVLIGLVILISNIIDVNLWRYVWPLLLIALGLWLVLRPSMVGPGVAVSQHILGDIRREGPWAVKEEEIWALIGDVRLNLAQALIPTGTTTLSIYGALGDVRVDLPPQVGVAVSATAVAMDSDILGQRSGHLLTPIEVVSDNYETAEQRLQLRVVHLAGDVRVRRIEAL